MGIVVTFNGSELVIDHAKPFLLDTAERVEFANLVGESDEVGITDWRVGDHCWYGKREWRDGPA